MSPAREKKIRSWSLLLSLCGLIVVGAGWALADEESSAGAPEGVVAKIGEVEITEAELEESASEQLMEVDRQRYQILEGALGALINQRLMEIEAEAQGISIDDYEQQEVLSKVAPVTDGEVDVFYEARKDRINQPKEQVAEQIRAFLASQRTQKAYSETFDALREKYEVTTFMEPLRVTVATDGAPSMGPDDAPVTIVEFSDFECPYCARVVPTLERVREEYGDNVRIVFMQYPLPNHSKARKAAEAGLCAGDQGKFWEMHDSMFATQRALGVDQLKAKAESLELDLEAFNECLDSGRHAARVDADLVAGRKAGVSSTPSLFINGRAVIGAQPFEAMAEVIDDELRRAGIQ
jgi:protein-disulfide isomerase